MRVHQGRRRSDRGRSPARLPLSSPRSPASESNLPLRLEETDVVGLLGACLKPLADQAARSRVDLHLATLGDVPRLSVDREKLAWSVTALVGNALRYVAHADVTGDVGGSVLVHVTREPGEGHVAISVQDDGPGIPTDKIPYLFERRAGAAHADGLALSLVRQIVTAHGGTIEVESRRDEDDHGTCITMMLPVGR
jgi:signal transduction histidine kinase